MYDVPVCTGTNTLRVVPVLRKHEWTHTAPHTTPHHADTPKHQTETETETETKREEKTEEQRQDRRREDKRQDKTRQEKRREKKPWPFFVGVVIFWLIPFAHVSLACKCQVRFIFSFLISVECTCSYSFHFFFGCIQLNYLFMQLQFFFCRILHKYSVEGYLSKHRMEMLLTASNLVLIKEGEGMMSTP